VLGEDGEADPEPDHVPGALVVVVVVKVVVVVL
jgi:hypothetical protein